MTGLAPARLHHIALTVRDLPASARWYEEAFDVQSCSTSRTRAARRRSSSTRRSRWRSPCTRTPPPARTSSPSGAPGLDHVGLVLPSRADLVRWQDHLEQHGVRRADKADRPLTQSPIADEFYGAVLVFRDPDNIQLELCVPPAS